MMQSLITISQADIAAMTDRLDRIERKLNAVTMAPKPEWLTLGDYASFVGKSPRTVKRWIEAGKVETSTVGGARMIRVNPNG